MSLFPTISPSFSGDSHSSEGSISTASIWTIVSVFVVFGLVVSSILFYSAKHPPKLLISGDNVKFRDDTPDIPLHFTGKIVGFDLKRGCFLVFIIQSHQIVHLDGKYLSKIENPSERNSNKTDQEIQGTSPSNITHHDDNTLEEGNNDDDRLLRKYPLLSDSKSSLLETQGSWSSDSSYSVGLEDELQGATKVKMKKNSSSSLFNNDDKNNDLYPVTKRKTSSSYQFPSPQPQSRYEDHYHLQHQPYPLIQEEVEQEEVEEDGDHEDNDTEDAESTIESVLTSMFSIPEMFENWSLKQKPPKKVTTAVIDRKDAVIVFEKNEAEEEQYHKASKLLHFSKIPMNHVYLSNYNQRRRRMRRSVSLDSAVYDNAPHSRKGSVDYDGERRRSSIDDGGGERRRSSIDDGGGERRRSSIGDGSGERRRSSIGDGVGGRRSSIGDGGGGRRSSIGDGGGGRRSSIRRSQSEPRQSIPVRRRSSVEGITTNNAEDLKYGMDKLSSILEKMFPLSSSTSEETITSKTKMINGDNTECPKKSENKIFANVASIDINLDDNNTIVDNPNSKQPVSSKKRTSNFNDYIDDKIASQFKQDSKTAYNASMTGGSIKKKMELELEQIKQKQLEEEVMRNNSLENVSTLKNNNTINHNNLSHENNQISNHPAPKQLGTNMDNGVETKYEIDLDDEFDVKKEPEPEPKVSTLSEYNEFTKNKRRSSLPQHVLRNNVRNSINRGSYSNDVNVGQNLDHVGIVKVIENPENEIRKLKSPNKKSSFSERRKKMKSKPPVIDLI